MNIKILKIEATPYWKFWTVDQLQVTIRTLGNVTKKLSIFVTSYTSEGMFLKYVEQKYLYGDQFYDIHQKQKEKLEPKIKLSDYQHFLDKEIEVCPDHDSCCT